VTRVPDRLPTECDVLFVPSYVGYADADVTGTLQQPPEDLIHRVHLVASPEPGLVTVCESKEGRRFLPGGRLEPGETLPEAARRELMEEAGSEVAGSLQPFFSQVAHSRRVAPYLPHVPHPIAWWTFVATKTSVTGTPTVPAGGEQVIAVHHLPVREAAEWLGATDHIHAAVVLLARHLDLI
jgi:8-oxo-dGTP diphosphatase